MSQVSVSTLKSQLSRNLREVRRGGEVQILDQGVPVARLTGLPTGSTASAAPDRERLAQEGIIRLGTGDASEILSRPPLELPVSILETLEEERTDRV